MRRSTLEYHFAPGTDARPPRVLALHGAGADQRQLLPLLARTAPHAAIVAPKAGRWSAWTPDGQRYAWYQDLSFPAVEPIGFGDALWQLERFCAERAGGSTGGRTRPPDRMDIVGFGQGAVLGLVLAAVWPERFRHVIALGGYWPCIKGWQPARRAMAQVQVTLLLDPSGPVGYALAQATGAELVQRGARVEVAWCAGAGDLRSASLDTQLAVWLSRPHS
ncbi:alpha/beta hydrolase [Cupriavidus nantongensis]|uniref:alpha/beta hydrolase n=1 Tax=Cupriavidus nantongensis TaxID=1796606 RepID=UPI00358F36FE